ncbi:MAG: hypothetical protein RSD13_06060 [Clostridium sp.]
MDKLEYLEFEEKHLSDNRSHSARQINRNKYGITYKDLQEYYGIEKYPNKDKSKTQNKRKERFSMDEIKDQVKLFKNIFDTEDEAFLRIRSKANGEYNSYNINSLMVEEKLYAVLNSNKFNSKEDLMYSLNLYNNMKSAEDKNLFSLHSIAIDVDFDEVSRFQGKKPIDIINILERLEFDKSIPKPSIIEYGNRLRLIYKLEKVYCTNASKNLTKRIAKIIGERLVDYGAKAQALTTYGRVVNSINSKCGKSIKVMYLDVKPYTLTSLQENWLSPLPEWYPEWKAKSNRKKSKLIILNGDFQEQAKARKYNLNRIDDIYKIQEYYDYECDGFRRFLCFQIRNHAKLAGMTNEEAKDVLREFNNRFNYPLRWNIIEQDTRNVERKQYLYKSETFLWHIGIQIEDEVLLCLKAILSEKEKARRNNEYNKAKQKAKYRNIEGLTKTEIKRRDEFIAIARMELEGISLRSIAKELNKDAGNLSKRINKVYDKINYIEIKQEVEKGLYDEMAILQA